MNSTSKRRTTSCGVSTTKSGKVFLPNPEVTSHNHLRIVKSSVFFLCHWSKKFQRHIATKLVRSIYSPQETLPQPHSR